MTQTIIGNWKMHGDPESGRALAQAIADLAAKNKPSAKIVLCPPATLLAALSSGIQDGIAWGGQDCHPQPKGAHTGDLSARMLKEAGAGYVIVGHSERRQDHAEPDRLVAAKAAAALAEEMIPIICVGESLRQREAGEAMQVVESQLTHSLPQGMEKGQFLVAYEPVWAIGTGKVATLEDIEPMHRRIKAIISTLLDIEEASVPVLYGGSVKASNARDILLCPAVDGVLVGGASLDPYEFSSIIDAART